MSVSKARLARFVKYMLVNEDVVSAIGDRIQAKLVARFRKGTLQERAMLSDLMDADSLFMKEVAIIIAENDETKVND